MPNRLSILILYALFLLPLTCVAQNKYQLAGKLLDSQDSSAILYASVVLTNTTDTLENFRSVSDSSGLFVVINLHSGRYKLKISFIGYAPYMHEVIISGQNVILSPIFLSQNTKQLKEVTVTGKAISVQVKGDTIHFNADTYKVHPDATAEDLVKKMPGVTTDGNTVKVNDEEVKKILVDGKPYFSDDPTATLRNLPAEIVSSVDVYDQRSDQALFTGIKDGNEEKTINLNTKKGMNTGQFGKAYVGYGADDRYNSGFTFNSFNGARRISVIGMFNNVNQQNFNITDLLNVLSNSGSQVMGPPDMGSQPDFFTNQQSGITGTKAIGVNYNDSWTKRIKVSGNYFFNYTDNKNTSSLLRNYYTKDTLLYQQFGSSEVKNLNHRFNFKFEYVIDTQNKITITPRLVYQSNQNTSNLTGKTMAGEQDMSDLVNKTLTNAYAYNFNNDLLFQHKFDKRGRTISFNVNTQLNTNRTEGNYYSATKYSDTSTSSTTNQQYTSLGTGKVFGANLSYTEPIGGRSILMVSYKPSISTNESDKKVNNIDHNGEYSLPDSSLSNTFQSQYHIERAGINYNLNSAKSVFTLGADVQNANLEATQTHPQTLDIKREYFNVLPTAYLNFKPEKNFNLDFTYRANTKSPGISQLANILDESNALFIKSGNPDLKQSYENNLTAHAMKRVPQKESYFIIFLRAEQSSNYIGNSTTILNEDTLVQNTIIKKGSQFIKPVNLENYYNINGFGAMGFPVRLIKSNLNINGGYELTNTPGLINNQLNYATSQVFKGGFYLGSNISQNIDFSLSYNGSYNTASNSIQTQLNSSYFIHTLTAKANYIISNCLVLNSDLSQYIYSGLSSSYNQSFMLWNASIGYKLLKNHSLEVKLYAYDILNQNKSITRTITESYSEDSKTQVLNRYFLVSLTYTFKHFKNNALGPEELKLPKDLPPPDNMPFPPPGR